MKHYLLFLLALLLSYSLWGQCPEGDVYLTSQISVDAFATNYPNCTTIEGDLIIDESSFSYPIHDLSGLSNITRVNGSVDIQFNSSLRSLAGLENLTGVGSYILIRFNPSLTRLAGLENLTTVGGFIDVYNNGLLATLAGLESLTTIGGSFSIRSNSSLTSLAEFENLTTVNAYLSISGNQRLTSLAGLENLTTVNGAININSNQSLTSLAGLEYLTMVDGSLSIYNNPLLTTLAGLENLTTVNGSLSIIKNPLVTILSTLENITSLNGGIVIDGMNGLSSLAGLEHISSMAGPLTITDNAALTSLAEIQNIDGSGITELLIQDNPMLSDCAVISICTYLRLSDAQYTISGNAGGCANAYEMEVACATGLQCPTADVTLRSQAEVDVFVTRFAECTAINGYLQIGDEVLDSDIHDLSGLSGLTTIAGSLQVLNNPNLGTLTGLDQITEINGQLNIRNNAVLTSIMAIADVPYGNITSMSIVDNPQLSSCEVAVVCDFVNNCGLPLITGNAAGCTSYVEVIMACGLDGGVSANILRGLPFQLTNNILRYVSLSEDGSRVMVIWEDPADDDYSYSLHAKVIEWNGNEWLAQAESPALLDSHYPSSQNGDYGYSRAVISADGKHVAVWQLFGHDDNYTRIWDHSAFEWTGTSWRELGNGLPGQGENVSISRDGRRIAIGGDEQDAYSADGVTEVFEWTGSSWRQVGQDIRGSHLFEGLRPVALSADGNRMVVSSPGRYNSPPNARGLIRTYDWNGGGWVYNQNEEIRAYAPNKMTMSGNGQRIRAFRYNYNNNSTRQFDYHTNRWQESEAGITDLGILSDSGNRLLTNDGNLYQWNTHEWVPIKRIPQTGCRASRYTLSGDGNYVGFYTAGRYYVYQLNFAKGFIYDLPEVCVNADSLTFQDAFSPAGGIISGPGVGSIVDTTSFSFDPVAAGVGTHELMYILGEDTFTTHITVIEPIPPVLALADTLVINDPGLVNITGMGQPEGGYYSDSEGLLRDDGNGVSFSLAESISSVSTTISYTVADTNACAATVNKTVVLRNESPYDGGPTPGQLGADIRTATTKGELGYSVSLSADGTRMAIGDPLASWGAVYVYERFGMEWALMGSVLYGKQLEERFGHSVSLSPDGNRLAVGFPNYTRFDRYAPFTESGNFQLFDWNGSTWRNKGSSYSATNLFYGSSSRLGEKIVLSEDGSMMVISQRPYGRVNTYRDNGNSLLINSQWQVDGTNSAFGQDIALTPDGQHLVVGEPATNQGAVHIYDWNGNGWTEVAEVTMPEGTDQFGTAVDITSDGTRIVVGAPQAEDSLATGYVRVLEWDGNAWGQVGPDIVGRTPGEEFGSELTISDDGTKLVIGAPGNNAAGTAAGRAALYSWDGSAWQEVEEMLFGGDRAYDQFGFSVAASADAGTVAIGAIQQDNPLSGGYVRVFAPCIPFNLQNKFSAICANVDPLTDLGGGCPVGGVYSGSGVTDNGDGETFTFDPSLSGVGEINITYQLDTLAYTNTIEVLPSPELSLALPDTLVLQSGMPVQITGSGLPTGGVYHNPGGLFTDNNDGLNLYYDGMSNFDTLQTISYEYTNPEGCTETISTEITTIVASFQHAMPTICANTEAVTNLGGGYPTGGSYSGPGVTDHGNGQTFTFDPAQAGVGEAIITYTIDTLSLTNSIEVLPLPTVTLSLPDTLFVTSGQSATLAGSGLPSGGVYVSSSGLFTDAGDGTHILYSGEADFADTQTIHYTYTDAQDCTQTVSAEVAVVAQVVGTNDLPEQVQAFQLFPNPTSDQIQVRLHCTEVADLQPQLYDLLGQQLWQSPLIRDRQLTQTLDLTAYPAGTYWLKVRVGEAWLSRRVVKVR